MNRLFIILYFLFLPPTGSCQFVTTIIGGGSVATDPYEGWVYDPTNRYVDAY